MESSNQDLSFRALKAAASRREARWVRGTEGFRTAGGKYTNLALILSDQCPWDLEVRSERGGTERLHGSVVMQLQEVVRTVLALRLRMNGSCGEPGEMPGVAFGEAVTNAICHRSYCNCDPLVVELRPDSVAVISPGGRSRMGSGFRMRSRNPRLVEALQSLGFAGVGITGMGAMMRSYKSCQFWPTMNFLEDATTVVLPDMVDLGSAYEGRKCNIIRLMLVRGSVRVDTVVRALGMNRRTVLETLEVMQDEGVVFMMSAEPGSWIFLTDKRYWLELASRSESGMDPYMIGRISGFVDLDGSE